MNRRKFLIKAGAMVPMSIGAGTFYSSGVFDTETLHIQQFKDTSLAHFSYAVSAGKKVIFIDPGRNPEQYYEFAQRRGLQIVGVIETHPHADFISSHQEIHDTTKATVYTSKLTGASYTHKSFDEDDQIELTKDVKLKAIHTPGHSPDSISIVLEEKGKDTAVFSGDALLFGDVGRPDLRGYSGDFATQKKILASQMYHTIRNKFATLEDQVKVFPAHGAGSLCGKAIRNVNESTIGYERKNNYAFNEMSEQAFVNILLSDQPLIPLYFPFDVERNKAGSPYFQSAVAGVPRLPANFKPASGERIIDARKAENFRKSCQQKAINIPDGGKFETWLGSIQEPEQKFYLVASSSDELDTLLAKAAKIGYESLIKGVYVYNDQAGNVAEEISVSSFSANPENYTIIDVRTQKESAGQPVFHSAINIPVTELTGQLSSLPRGKPVVIHCASGYRSAIAASIIKGQLPNLTVYDLGETVSTFIK